MPLQRSFATEAQDDRKKSEWQIAVLCFAGTGCITCYDHRIVILSIPCEESELLMPLQRSFATEAQDDRKKSEWQDEKDSGA